jgi:hypothetical protein
VLLNTILLKVIVVVVAFVLNTAVEFSGYSIIHSPSPVIECAVLPGFPYTSFKKCPLKITSFLVEVTKARIAAKVFLGVSGVSPSFESLP